MTVSADEYSAEAPPFASFFGVLGGSFAMCLAAAGATYATAKAGTGISGMAVVAPNAVMKALLPVVMAGTVIFQIASYSIVYYCILFYCVLLCIVFHPLQ